MIEVNTTVSKIIEIVSYIWKKVQMISAVGKYIYENDYPLIVIYTLRKLWKNEKLFNTKVVQLHYPLNQ